MVWWLPFVNQLWSLVFMALGGFQLLFPEENQCRMTFMFKYPQYIHIPLPPEVKARFPYYSLHVYGEGRYADELRDGIFRGIPVLFLPGSGGSHKQVRSFGSVAYQKAQVDNRLPFHFNVFAVHFDEEIAGAYGPVLHDQVKFVSHCVDHILSLYQLSTDSSSSEESSREKPTSVAILAHSMGGLIPEYISKRNSGFDFRKINVVLALSTPFKFPPMLLDPWLASFYSDLHCQDQQRKLTLISLVGGSRDWIIPALLTPHPNATLQALTVSIPDVWVSTDHQCIIWCNQLVRVTVRALFDMVDLSRMQISSNLDLRSQIASYHFSGRSAGKKFRTSQHPVEAQFLSNARWLEVFKRQWTMDSDRLEGSTYFMVPLLQNDMYEKAVMYVVNSEVRDWVFACKRLGLGSEGQKVCERADNLSKFGRILPSLSSKRKVIHLDMSELRRTYSHLIVFVPARSERESVRVDIFGAEERQLKPKLNMLNPSRQTVVVATLDKALSYNVTLEGFSAYWKAFDFRLTKLPAKECPISEFAHVILHVPWSQEGKYWTIPGNETSSVIQLALQIPPPAAWKGNFRWPHVEILLHPKCQYSFDVGVSLWGVLSQVTRASVVFLPAFFVFVLLIGFSQQLHVLRQTGSCSTLVTVSQSVKGLIIACVSLKLADVLSKATSSSESPMFLPETDAPAFLAREEFSWGYPPLLFFASSALITFGFHALWAATVIYGNSLKTILFRFFGKVVSRNPFGEGTTGDLLLDVAYEGISRFPIVLSLVLVVVSLGTCGATGLVLGGVAYFLKIGKIYEDFLETALFRTLAPSVGIGAKDKKPKAKSGREGAESVPLAAEEEEEPGLLTRVRFHLTLLMCWVSVILVNLPTLIVWMKRARDHHMIFLSPDPSIWPSLILCAVLPLLWQDRLPTASPSPLAEWLPGLLSFLALVAFLNGLLHVYVLSYCLSLAVAVVAIDQTLARPKVKTE